MDEANVWVEAGRDRGKNEAGVARIAILNGVVLEADLGHEVAELRGVNIEEEGQREERHRPGGQAQSSFEETGQRGSSRGRSR